MLLIRNCFKMSKRNVSALYITGDRATEHCSILVPHMDFADKLKNRKRLEENISRRRLTAAYNLEELYQYYDLYSTFTQRLSIMEERRQEILTAVQKLMEESEENGTKNNELMRKFQEENKLLKVDIKQLKAESYSIDDKFVHDYLALPNEIHARTPDEMTVIASHGEIQLIRPETDVQGIVDYFDETAFYLEKDAAKFDLFFPLYWIDRLRERGFVQFSNPDFVKSILIEAAGLPLNEVFEVKEKEPDDSLHLLHLVGNGSMISYLGYIARLIVEPAFFPLKFVCTGKQYVPKEPNELGLYGVSQSTVLQVFCAGKEEQIEQQFDDVLKLVDDLFSPLGLHYRIVYEPPHELKLAESLRARVEMFSNLYNRYIEVGNVSCYGNFISERLLFNYKDDSDVKYPHVISGTICNVTRIIALLLEKNGPKFRIPSYLEKYASE